MIIPIRCMSCGNVIADKWSWYKNELAAASGRLQANRPPLAGDGELAKRKAKPEERLTIDGTQIPQSLELELMNRLGFKRPCCRKHFLTHVDLIEKI